MDRRHDAAGSEAPGGARAAGLARRRRRASRARRRRRLIGLTAVVGLAAAVGSQLFGGGGAGRGTAGLAGATTAARSGPHATRTRGIQKTGAAAAARAQPLVVRAPQAPGPAWTPTAWVQGRPAAWLALRGGVALMRFDQHGVHLTLHAGSLDGGVAGWTYGDEITPREIHHVVAGFNGGFKLTYSNVGFESGGHVAVPLKSGLGSLVTYTDGTSAVGAWHYGVPDSRKHVFSVLQNQQLLVDRGRAAANVATCVLACWGATIRSLTVVARSGIGITAGGQIVWAAGEQLTPATLASALIGAGAIRAIELDINPAWVDGYLYTHHPSGPAAVPVVPGQRGIAGALLAPDTRDFLAVVAN